MTIKVFPSDKSTPQQTLLKATEVVGEMDHVAVIYIPKGKIHPFLYCSSMLPVDMNFLGAALQNYSLSYMED